MEIDRVAQMKAVQAEGLELFKRKNADYGDAFAKFGVIGVLMRIEIRSKGLFPSQIKVLIWWMTKQ